MCILCSIEKRNFFPYNNIQRIKVNSNKLKEERQTKQKVLKRGFGGMKKVIIIGAGPAGLTAGYDLISKSSDYEVTSKIKEWESRVIQYCLMEKRR